MQLQKESPELDEEWLPLRHRGEIPEFEPFPSLQTESESRFPAELHPVRPDLQMVLHIEPQGCFPANKPLMEAQNSSEPFEAADSPDQFFDAGTGGLDQPPTDLPAERTFQCSCGKEYQSYSALYSHNKQKHNGDRANLPSGRGGRSRGRPRKNGEAPRPRARPDKQVQEAEVTEDNSFFQNRALLGCTDPRSV